MLHPGKTYKNNAGELVSILGKCRHSPAFVYGGPGGGNWYERSTGRIQTWNGRVLSHLLDQDHARSISNHIALTEEEHLCSLTSSEEDSGSTD